MGLWGMTLFQSDTQCDIRSEVQYAMGILNIDDDDCDPDKELQSIEFREKLDAGLCEKLFEDFRSKEHDSFDTVVLAALVMESGAKISDDNVQRLRDIAGPVHSNNGLGLFGSIREQLLAALEHYKPGEPRSFSQKTQVKSMAVSFATRVCYNCGKIKADISKKLAVCAKCKEAPYCDRNCQKAHWKTHKSFCY
ncbi:hypothetical protein Daus18300_002354 [Diaporthe australafricana]|uniref:MYND-type domain-containing protein n=1 Tax=Diaporthe australafricana TaxID=127596 RepID=A0ABR3XQJ7_9PEZI